MFSRFNRGSSVLAALVLVGALAVATLAVQALSGPQNPQAQSAAGNVWDNAQTVTTANITATAPTTPTSAGSSFSNNSPKDCNAAKKAALNMVIGPGAISMDSGASGILDSCHGAVSKTGKASPNLSDYGCVGRSGTVLISGQPSIVRIATNPDRSVKDGTCKVDVCNGSLQNCGPAKQYNGGVFASSLTGVTAGTNVPQANFITNSSAPGYSGLIAPTETRYFLNGNGTYTIVSAFSPSTAPTTPLEGWSNTYDGTIAWPAEGNPAAQLPFAPTNVAGDPTIYSAGLRGCADGNCDTLTKEDLTPDSTTNPNEGASEPKIGAGDIVPKDYHCIKSIDPFDVREVPAGTAFPSGCYNDKNAPPLPKNRQQTFPQGPGTQQQTPEKPGGGGGGLDGIMKAILGGLAQGLAKSLAQPPAAPACSSDPNAYAQQQQQYNQQLQQYNYQLQQYNYQQQLNQLSGGGFGGYGATGGFGGYGVMPPMPPQPCQQTSNTNTCPAAPAQPNPAGCQNGTWRPLTTQQSNGYQCTTGWQCVPGGTVVPTAQISCQPQVADVGMTITISYGCGNSTGSTGQGFDTGNQTSGSTTTVISTPPAGATGANFLLNCTNQGASAQAQCSVQIGRPTIVLIANPKVVASGSASTIGWITTGMQSCVVSSPEDGAFTAENALNTSVNGMASTSPLTSPIHILLHCVTIGGGTRDATTTVNVVGQPDITDQDPNTGSVTVWSDADGASASRGGTVNVSWRAADPPSGAHIALWLYDVRLQATTALIRNELAASSTYAWQLPTATSTCDATSNMVCGTDLIPGRSYGIEAALYTDTSDPNNPDYIDYGFTPDSFTISS